MPISKEEFREALSCFPSGVTVVTTKDGDGNLHGITVSAFCSVSLEPPLVLICIDKNTASHYAFEETGFFAVNILSEDQKQVSSQFASPRENKFDGVEFDSNGMEIPILKGALVNLECRLRDSHDGGDHTIFIGEIEKAHLSEGKPLVYCNGDYRELT